jgi:capsular exopolysaccharide synthesis family protein
MDLKMLAQALVRRWWLVVLAVAAGLATGYYVAANVHPRYQSTVSLQLNPAARSSFLPYLGDPGTGAAPNPVTALAASYREVLRTRAFGELLVQQLNLSAPPADIANAIGVQLVPNTNILRLSFTWDNPSDAQQLAQRVAEIFIAENLRRQQAQPGTQAQLAELEQSARTIQSRLAPLNQQRERLDQAMGRGDLTRLTELTELDARTTSLESSYANLLVEISRVRASFDTAVIIDSASPPAPVDGIPVIQAALIGLLGGLAVAIGLVSLLEYLADSIRSPRDVAVVAGVLPLGRVPHANTWLWRRTGRFRALVMLNKVPSPAAEAFRSLRTSIKLSTPLEVPRALVVTSAGPREGKTFVAANLAIALAQAGKRVVLVDADLRRPTVHAWFRVPNSSGLADVLSKGTAAAADDFLELPGLVHSGIDNLWLMTAGSPPTSPGELLGTDALTRVLDRLAEVSDTIVFDTAPVGPIADTLLVAHYCSGSLVVARAGRTRRSALRGALAALWGTRRPILGVVLNDERPHPLARFSHDDYYHYGYWSNTPPAELHGDPAERFNGRGHPQVHVHAPGGVPERD